MTQVSEYVKQYTEAQTAFMDRQDAAIDGISSDFDQLKADIAKLNASAGVLNAEDEALLGSITTRSEKISTKLEALDAMTAPPVPDLPLPDPTDPNVSPQIPPEALAARRREQAMPSQGTPGSVQPTAPGTVVNPGGTGTMPASAAVPATAKSRH